MVISHLPSLNKRFASQMFSFQMMRPHEVHSSIWSRIWREDSTWPSFAENLGLNLALVGDDLHILGKDPNSTAYLALVTGDISGDIRFRKAELLSSLQPHHRNGSEIVFRHSKIVLNIDDALHSPEIIMLATERLFSCPIGGLRSACLYWKDREHAIHTIRSEGIIGLGERTSTMKDVEWICDITLPQLPESFLERKQRQAFKQPNCPGVRSIFEPGAYGNLLGWEQGSY